MAARVELKKDLLGRYSVAYDCPRCGTGLKSRVEDAGNRDSCPECGVQYAVPGAEHRERIAAVQKAADERKAHERQEAAEVRARQKAESQRELAEAQRRERDLRERQQAERQMAEIAKAAAAAQPKPKRRFGKKSFAFLLLVLLPLYSWGRSQNLRDKLRACDSFGTPRAEVYYRGFLGTEDVVFDLRSGGYGARRIDPLHLFLQFATKLPLYHIRRVYLATNGKEKFFFLADDLKPLADSYEGGGVIWAFDNTPSMARRLNGDRAYSEWTGGWLGVLKQQTEDLADFLKAWIGD